MGSAVRGRRDLAPADRVDALLVERYGDVRALAREAASGRVAGGAGREPAR